mmetsp:Transcript_141250/g.451456  ORF Transcript_141250/g.451456 Transcript_141250/m.451456 type:complete len:187 (-) Transcript_141250:144-704(-)
MAANGANPVWAEMAASVAANAAATQPNASQEGNGTIDFSQIQWPQHISDSSDSSSSSGASYLMAALGMPPTQRGTYSTAGTGENLRLAAHGGQGQGSWNKQDRWPSPKKQEAGTPPPAPAKKPSFASSPGLNDGQTQILWPKGLAPDQAAASAPPPPPVGAEGMHKDQAAVSMSKQSSGGRNIVSL